MPAFSMVAKKNIYFYGCLWERFHLEAKNRRTVNNLQRFEEGWDLKNSAFYL